MNVPRKVSARETYVLDEEDLDELDQLSMTSLVREFAHDSVARQHVSEQEPLRSDGAFTDPEINALLDEAGSTDESSHGPQRTPHPIEPRSTEGPDCLVAAELIFPELAVDDDDGELSLDRRGAERSRKRR